jgi:DUF4097 and DUF4098 domain-containing protein YvlB
MTVSEQVGEFISVFTNAVVPTAHARTPLRALTCSTKPEPPTTPEQQTTDEFRWSGALQAGKTIEVRGINGNIDAQASSSNQIEVVAHKRSRRTDVSSVQIKVVEHAGGVTICAQYPTEDGSYTPCDVEETSRQSGRKSDVRTKDVSVDFEVRVPQGVNLEARTINGDVSAKSLASNVTLRTINGSIEVSTSGYAEATTVNGGITAKLGSSSWTGPLNFTTVNGAIAVDMPSNLSTDIEATTLNGTIQSDFPLELQAGRNGKNIRGRIGSGGRELVLKTVNGSINLRMS